MTVRNDRVSTTYLRSTRSQPLAGTVVCERSTDPEAGVLL
jgi:hypothetical protein